MSETQAEIVPSVRRRQTDGTRDVDVYEAFPPIEVPTYERPVPEMPIKQIFYEEDIIRA